jgi:hypothetical protein
MTIEVPQIESLDELLQAATETELLRIVNRHMEYEVGLRVFKYGREGMSVEEIQQKVNEYNPFPPKKEK